MADDEYAYLQPDFDPSTLTIPRLRSILVAHNISYPSSAKKPDLVTLFKDNVAPQARKIRNAQSRTKRSAKGIVDVPSSQGSVAGEDEDEDEDEVEPLEAPVSVRRTSRRTTRAQTEEAVAATPRVSRTSRQSTAPISNTRSPVKHARGEEVEQEDEPKRLAPKRSKQSISPAIVQQQEVVEPKYREGPESPFTKENPFQSGSSPPAPSRSKSRDRRRTTLGPVGDTDRKSREVRRRTDGYKAAKQEDGVVVPSSRTFEMPVSRTQRRSEEAPDTVHASEEFTPEEQLDLAQTDGTVAVRPKRRRQPRSGVAKAAPWSILVALLGGVATVWRQEKLQVGYCGVGQPSNSLAGVEIPEWASAIQPQCEPCPQHAYCYPDLKTVCEQDFVLTGHPLSFNGLIPLPPTCEPDSEKVRKIKQVADFAVETELRERNAKYECGEVKTPEVAEQELKATVSAKRSKRMSDEEFNELWESAIGEIIGRDEVVSKVDGTATRRLRSTSLARLSFGCAVRRSLRSTLRQHLPKLVALLFISLSAVYGRHALVARRSTSTRAKQLAGTALDKLATQASLHATDAVAYPEPYVSMVALRDDVLREEFSASERTRLWNVVKGLVEGNANVRSMVREGRTGDVSRVWEWIGAVHLIESPDVGRRSSQRFSLGGPGRIAGSSPGGYGDVKEEAGEEGYGRHGKEMVERNRWNEGSPYY